ncbi:MAG: hypothetical protein K2N93_05635, partial [Alistipes sp.]|nr:hypothetical protein [Alistipes sp.]
MEDFILREIDRIGTLLRALLEKTGALRQAGESRRLCETARSELLGDLGLDLDALLASEDFIDRLTADHGFAEEHLELAAELLADLAGATDDRPGRQRLAAAALAIYRRLDAAGAPASFNRYYVLPDLEP